eukprot:m51a1_g14258 hypothetical protein (177) ;mRNA; r:294911-295554
MSKTTTTAVQKVAISAVTAQLGGIGEVAWFDQAVDSTKSRRRCSAPCPSLFLPLVFLAVSIPVVVTGALMGSALNSAQRDRELREARAAVRGFAGVVAERLRSSEVACAQVAALFSAGDLSESADAPVQAAVVRLLTAYRSRVFSIRVVFSDGRTMGATTAGSSYDLWSTNGSATE